METEFGVNITANAAGVAPGVQQAESQLQGLEGVLAQLVEAFNGLAAEMRVSMEQGAAATSEMAQEMHVLEEETHREAISLKEMALSAREGLESFKEMRESLMGLGELMMAAFAVEMIAEWAEHVAEAAEKVEHLHEQFGMATNDIRQMQGVAMATGISFDTITRSLGLLDKKLFSSGEEGSKTGALFKQLGISADNASDQMKLLLAVSDKFAEMEDGPKKAALAMQLFGRSGREMIPILNLGSAGIEEMTAKVTEYGVANTKTSEDAQKTGLAMAESINENKLAWQGITNVLTDAFGPVLKEIVDSMNHVIKAMIDSYDSGGTVAVVFGAIAAIVEVVGAVIDALAGVFKALWTAAIEVVTEIAGVFADLFGVSIPKDSHIASDALNDVKMVFIVLKDAIIICVEIIRGAIVMVVDYIRMFAKVAHDSFTLNWDAIDADWKQGTDRMAHDVELSAKRIEVAMTEAKNAIVDAYNSVPVGGAPKEKEKPEHHGGGGFDPHMGGGAHKEKKPSSRMDEWEAKLEAQKVALQEQAEAQGTFEEMSKQSEADYWKAILDKGGLSHDEQLAVEKKYLGLRLEIRHEEFDTHMAMLAKELDAAKGNANEQLKIANQMLADTIQKYGTQSKQAEAAKDRIVQIEREKEAQIRQIQAIATKSYEDLLNDAVTTDELAARHRVAMGAETDAQLLQEEVQFENRRFEIKQQALVRLQALIDPMRDPVRYAQMSQQIEELERQHQMRLTQIAHQQQMQRSATERQAVNSIGALWGSNISKLLTMQQSFAATIHSIYVGMVGIIANALGSIIQKWITQHLAALVLKRTSEATEGVAAVTTNAAVAGAAAFASIAAIPIVGPALAPEAAAAAFAGAMAFAPIASAAGGWDRVPMDGAMSMLHLDEMVLPASIASPLRSLLSEWGTGPSGVVTRAQANVPASWQGDGGGGGGAMGDVHFHIHAMDTKTGARWLMDNRAHVASSVKQAYQDGHR